MKQDGSNKHKQFSSCLPDVLRGRAKESAPQAINAAAAAIGNDLLDATDTTTPVPMILRFQNNSGPFNKILKAFAHKYNVECGMQGFRVVIEGEGTYIGREKVIVACAKKEWPDHISRATSMTESPGRKKRKRQPTDGSIKPKKTKKMKLTMLPLSDEDNED